MDTLARLKHFQEERGWSAYRLAKNCGLSENTIANIFRRNTQPSIPTLEAICHGFGITLAQFFTENEMIEVTPELEELLALWLTLTPRQKESILQVCRCMNQAQPPQQED